MVFHWVIFVDLAHRAERSSSVSSKVAPSNSPLNTGQMAPVQRKLSEVRRKHTQTRAPTQTQQQVDLTIGLIRLPQLCCQTLASAHRLSAIVKLGVFKIRFNIDHFHGLNRAWCQRVAGAIPHPPSVCLALNQHQSVLGEMEKEKQVKEDKAKLSNWKRGKAKKEGRIGGTGDENKDERKKTRL